MPQDTVHHPHFDSVLGWHQPPVVERIFPHRHLCVPRYGDRSAWLRLEIKYFIKPSQPRGRINDLSDGLGNRVRVREWHPGEAADWGARFRQVILDGWHARFQLEPTTRVGSTDRVLNDPIACMLRLTPVGARELAHLIVRVHAVDQTTPTRYRSHAYAGGASHRLQTDMTLLSTDLEERGGQQDLQQVPALHEFGHYLGLREIGRGTAHPYGRSGSPEERDLMGRGSNWQPEHGAAWLDRLRVHRRGYGFELRSLFASAPPDWRVRLARPQP